MESPYQEYSDTSLTQFDLLVQQRNQLKAWLSIGDKIAWHSPEKYSIVIDPPNLPLVAYCGQEYTEGRTYYRAPDFIELALSKELQKKAEHILQEVVAQEAARLDAEIEAMRADVLAALNQD